MKVTRVKIDSLTPSEKLKATCTVVLDDSLCIHHIHVIEGDRGLFIGFPNTGSMKLFKKSKRFVDIVHPCSDTLRRDITTAVLEEYNNIVK